MVIPMVETTKGAILGAGLGVDWAVLTEFAAVFSAVQKTPSP